MEDKKLAHTNTLGRNCKKVIIRLKQALSLDNIYLTVSSEHFLMKALDSTSHPLTLPTFVSTDFSYLSHLLSYHCRNTLKPGTQELSLLVKYASDLGHSGKYHHRLWRKNLLQMTFHVLR